MRWLAVLIVAACGGSGSGDTAGGDGGGGGSDGGGTSPDGGDAAIGPGTDGGVEGGGGGDAGPQGPTLKPNPLISRGKPIESPQSDAKNAFDGSYDVNKGVWQSNNGAGDGTIADSWVKIDIGVGPTSLLLVYYNNDTFDYTVPPDQNYGVATDYTIETSADGTTWKKPVTVTATAGVTYRNRGHRFDFTGMRYVRFTMTKCTTTTGGNNAHGRIVEMDVFDASLGVEDTWLFAGSGPIRSGYDGRITPSYADLVHTSHAAYNPAVIDIADTEATSAKMLTQLDGWIALNPDYTHWVLPYGLYETSAPLADYIANMQQAVDKLKAAGKQPIVPRLSYVAPAGCGSEQISCPLIDAFNTAIDAFVAKNGLLPGADLHAWFAAHPEQLCVSGQCETNWIGIEPNDLGVAGENAQWALTLDPLYKK